jgi:hypothetical protein
MGHIRLRFTLPDTVNNPHRPPLVPHPSSASQLAAAGQLHQHPASQRTDLAGDTLIISQLAAVAPAIYAKADHHWFYSTLTRSTLIIIIHPRASIPPRHPSRSSCTSYPQQTGQVPFLGHQPSPSTAPHHQPPPAARLLATPNGTIMVRTVNLVGTHRERNP